MMIEDLVGAEVVEKDGERIYLNAEKMPSESGEGYFLGIEALTEEEIFE